MDAYEGETAAVWTIIAVILPKECIPINFMAPPLESRVDLDNDFNVVGLSLTGVGFPAI